MTASLPWGSRPQNPPSNDPSEALLRIDRNMASLLSWMKILVIAVIVLVVLTALVI